MSGFLIDTNVLSEYNRPGGSGSGPAIGLKGECMPYVFGSGVPYGKYLQAQALVDDLKVAQARELNCVSLAVESGTREIVASLEVLRDQNVHLQEAVTQGFDQLSWEIREVRTAVEDLNATFVWGFNAILCHTGRMADALEALLAAVKTPTKTRAYEYFDDARTAFTRGHHKDALDLIEKAIAGDHTSSGYRLEWRFHLLKGSILVGTISHPELLDLKSAEQTYRTAADYASTDDRHGAALALLGASWACYCQGQLPEAFGLCESALKFHTSFGEALFQSAKILMAMGRSDDAASRLAAALEVDPDYVLKAAGDGDFQARGRQFEAWVRAHRETKERELLSVYGDLSKDGRFWLRCVEQRVDLRHLVRTLTRKEPALYDLLCALRTLRSVESDKIHRPQSPQDAAKALRAIPPQLHIPPELLGSLLADRDKWKADGPFFDLSRVLVKRRELEALRPLLEYYPWSQDAPLELFASRLEAFPVDGSATSAIASMLERRGAETREHLIDEYDKLSKSGSYSERTIEAIRAAVVARYEGWLPAIEKSLRQSAFVGTEHPGKGVIGRFAGSFFGFLIPAAIVEAIAGTALGLLLWLAGIAAVVFTGVVKRSDIRAERLRQARDMEARLRARLDPRTPARR